MQKIKATKPKRPQSDDFESVAKRLGCDTDMEKFKEKLGKMARAKPVRTKGG